MFKGVKEDPNRLNLSPPKGEGQGGKKGYSKRSILVLMVSSILGILICLTNLVTYTYSYFHAERRVPGNKIEVDQVSKYLTINPEDLDLGYVPQGSRKIFKNVLSLKNISNKGVIISWSFDGTLAEFFEEQEGSFILFPTGKKFKEQETVLSQEVYDEDLVTQRDVYPDGESKIENINRYASPYKLNFRLKGGRKEPGSYSGYITIKVNDKLLKKTIPVSLIITKEKLVSPSSTEKRQDTESTTNITYSDLREPIGEKPVDLSIKKGLQPDGETVDFGSLPDNDGVDQESPEEKDPQELVKNRDSATEKDSAKLKEEDLP